MFVDTGNPIPTGRPAGLMQPGPSGALNIGALLARLAALRTASQQAASPAPDLASLIAARQATYQSQLSGPGESDPSAMGGAPTAAAGLPAAPMPGDPSQPLSSDPSSGVGVMSPPSVSDPSAVVGHPGGDPSGGDASTLSLGNSARGIGPIQRRAFHGSDPSAAIHAHAFGAGNQQLLHTLARQRAATSLAGMLRTLRQHAR